MVDGAAAGERVASDLGEDCVANDGEGDEGRYDANGDGAGDVVPPAAVYAGGADDDEEAEREADLEAAEVVEEVGLRKVWSRHHGCDEI